MLLDPPLMLQSWTDYCDPKSRELLRTLEVLKERYGSLLRLRRRYYPKETDELDGWSKAITAVELARAKGRYTEAHALMIAEAGGSWQERVDAVVAKLAAERVQAQAERMACNRSVECGVCIGRAG